MKLVTVTYYLDVISSWCHWIEPAWRQLKQDYSGRVQFDWKIALMDESGMPKTQAEEEWYYRRSGTIMRSSYMLNASWFVPGLKEYLAPNAVPMAARELGVDGDDVRIAIAEAGMLHGLQFADWDVCVDAALKVCRIDRHQLMATAKSAALIGRMRETTAEFHGFKMTVRPSFLIANNIGDRAVFSGLASAAPLRATIDAMLADAEAYRSYAVHHGGPP